MDAQLGSKPSYIWRSILWSRDIIQKGLIASGRSSLRGSSESVMVHELISIDRIWNEVEVRAKFPSFEAELILDIPLRRHTTEELGTGTGELKAIILLNQGTFSS